jgi:hypothetical protein
MKFVFTVYLLCQLKIKSGNLLKISEKGGMSGKNRTKKT